MEFKRLMWGALESQAVDIGGLSLGDGFAALIGVNPPLVRAREGPEKEGLDPTPRS
jgi:dolichol kinase